MNGIDALGMGLRLTGSLAAGTSIPGGVARTSAAMARLQQQIALGRAMLSPGDDPIRSAVLSRLAGATAADGRIRAAIERAVSLLEASDPFIAESVDLIDRARDMGIQGRDSSTLQSDRDSLADQLDQVIDRLLQVSNATHDGVHLFGGTRTRMPAFERLAEGVAWMGRGAGMDVGAGDLATISGDRLLGGESGREDFIRAVNLSNGWETPLAGFAAGGLGQIRISVGQQVRTVDLSNAVTIRDFANLVEGLGLGVRVEMDQPTGRVWIRNGLSGASLSIQNVGADDTASRLGIRTFDLDTRLAEFNDGRGVRFSQPGVDPVTGEPANLNGNDLSIRLHDGRTFVVDFTTESTVGEVIATVNAAATAAGVNVPGEFSIGLQTGTNGFLLTDNTGGPFSFEVNPVDNGWAALDLGIKAGTSGAQIAGEDRATIAVDGAFTHLLRLRDALRANDAAGMTFAIEGLDRAFERASSARTLAGARSARFQDERTVSEERAVQNESLRSSLEDLDVADAATRLSSLSTQLQAGLLAIGRTSTLSLLDFLR